MENEIVVEIRGVTASGKSTLVQLFEQVLAVHGIEVEVTYFDARPPPSEQTYRLKALRESGLKVHIIEKQTTKEEHCGFWKCEDCSCPRCRWTWSLKGTTMVA